MGSDGAAIAVDPSLAMERYFVPQGISADLIATMSGFSRSDCDSYAAESHRRAARAWSEGRFKNSVVAVRDRNGIEILGRDEAVRPETSEEALGELKPSFAEQGESMPGLRQNCDYEITRMSKKSITSITQAIPPASSTERRRRLSARENSANAPAYVRAPGS